MMYYRYIANMSITNDVISKNFILTESRKAKLYSRRILAVVLQRFFHVEMKIHKPTQIQALIGMKKKRPTFPGNILDVIQKD